MSRLTYILYILFLLAVFVAGAGVWCYARPLPMPETVTANDSVPLAAFDKRHMEHMTLHTAGLGDIGIALSLPDPLPQEKIPVLIVLGGLGTGEDNIRNIRDAGNNAIIGYDWPMPVRIPGGIGFLQAAPDLYRDVMRVPGQIASAGEWLSNQPWADNKRISILGYSLGAMAAPAAQDLMQQNLHMVHSTIIAYGGAPLSGVFAADKHLKPDWMRAMLTPIIAVLLHPLEPAVHLRNLEGSFLVLEGKDDNLIPADLRTSLREAVPPPKKIVDFEGDHMGVGPGKEELLQKIIAASRQWLLEEEAVNPL